MKTIRSFFSRWQLGWHSVSEWPFMLFLSAVFVFIYFWAVVTSTRLREPVLLTVFTVLFSVHLGLHWISMWWLKKQWNAWAYLGIQAALVFVLVSIAGVIGALVGLYLGLIGEAVGMLSSSSWKKGIAIAGILALSALNCYRILPAGEILWWAVAIVPLTFFVIIYVLLYTRQATAREKAQRLLVELEAANRRLTEYADRIEELTLADERQRMARELHDTLAQGLAGLVLQLEAADMHLGSGRPERAQTIVQQAMARARATLAESRRAIDGLRKQPPADLEDAVRAEVDHFESVTGVPCALKGSPPESLSAADQELVVRTVAEGLTNIARHAKTRHAWIRLRTEGKTFVLEIADDGIGFDPLRDSERAGHYGLTGLRERAGQAGGTLEIDSSAGKGSTLRMRIPLPSTDVPGEK